MKIKNISQLIGLIVKYNKIMFIKNILINLDEKIASLLGDLKTYDYCIIHNNPSINHLLSRMKNYLISFDYSTVVLKFMILSNYLLIIVNMMSIG